MGIVDNMENITIKTPPSSLAMLSFFIKRIIKTCYYKIFMPEFVNSESSTYNRNM